MKEKKGTGLSRDKNLRVNKNAGYKFVKKDKSVNKRAGLHDKKKNIAEGERRVVRCKPLALKHKRRMRKAAVALAAICVGAVSYVGMGFLFKPDGLSVEDLGNYTVKAQRVGDNSKPAGGGKVYYFPEDGSLPTDHTLIENVAYLNYVLNDVQTSWSSSMKSTVYTVMNQTVYNHKKSYKDEAAGIYSFVSADKAVGASGMETQFCVTEEEVLWRDAAINSPEDKLEKQGYNMDIVDWDENKFYGNTLTEFRSYRGLPANDFSVYILDENTVKNANDTTVKDNGDGTYTMTLDLKVHQEGPDSAVHYYKQTMYINGGLYAWPTFDYTRVTYNFTADWQLLSFTINDSYSAKMGVIAAACTSESTTVFSYDKENGKNTYRPDAFAAHEGGNYIRYSPYGTTRTLDATTCLANAFGSVLEEGATFKLDMSLNGRDVSGAIYVGLNDGSISDLRVALGELKVFLGEDNGKQTLFLAAGKDKFRLCTEGLFGSDSGSENTGESGGNALAGILDVNDLMKQLFAGEFDLQEKSASLKSTISLFGLDIPVEFAFNVRGLDASLDYVSTSFSLNGSPVKARLEFGTEEDIPAAPEANEKAQYKDILNGGLTLNLKLGLDKLVLNGAAEIKLENGKFTGVNAYLGNYAAHYNAENGLVYLNLDGYKYKLDSKKLSGGNGSAVALSETVTADEENGASALRQLISFIVGGISTDGNGLNFNGALAADNGFNVLGTVIKLGVDVNLRGYLGVNADIEFGGKTAFAEVSVAENNSAIPQIGNVNEYKDILNEGVTFGVSLSLDGLKLEGEVDIAMKNGAFKQVSAKLGDFTVYYTANDKTLYYGDTSGNRYKIALGALTGGAQTQSEGGFDLNGLIKGPDIKSLLKEIISNLSAADGSISTGASVNLFEQIIKVAADISLNDGLKVGLNAELAGKKIAASVWLAESTLSELKPAEYKDILNEGVSLSVNSLKIDGLDLSGSVYLGLKEGKIDAVRASLSNKEGDVAVHFNSADNMLYIKVGEGVKVKLPLSALGLGENNGDGTQAQSSVLNGLLNSIDLNAILTQLFNNLTCGENSLATSVALDIKDLGKVNIGATVSLAGGIGADLTVDILNKNISLGASLAKDVEVPELTAEQKAEYADILNEGFNVNGNLQVTVGETVLNLAINKLAVSLQLQQDGTVKFGFALDTRLTVKDMYFDFFVSYLNGVATVVYGDTENYFGAKLDIAGGDLGKLEEALVSVYNRISAVLDEIITNNPLKPTDKAGLESQLTVDNLTGILSKLGVAISLEQGGANVLEMLGIPQNNGKLDIKGLINGLQIYSPEGAIFGVTLGNMALQLKNSGISASVDLEMANSAVRVYLENLSLGLYSEPACPVKDSDLLTAGDFAEMLDYLAAAAELLIEDEYSLSANATVYENDAVSYEVKILFEYIKGEKFPVQITLPATDKDGNKTGLNVAIADDMYWHLGVTMDNADANKDDLYIDVYILDCNPAVENGVTTNGKTATGNGLDVYVSVSKYGSKELNENYAPLKVYAPVNEILTVLAAGVALLDLQNIDISEESAALQSVISQLATLLDDALVKAYLPLTHSQFNSLGASLIPQIIGSDISTLLKDILKTLSTPVGGEEEEDKSQPENGGVQALNGETEGGNKDGETPITPEPEPKPEPKHYINKVSLGTSGAGDRMLQIILNSNAIYGAGFENLTFEAYKNYAYGTALIDGESGETEAGEENEPVPVPVKSYITGAAVKNIYFGGNQKLDLGLGVVRSVEKQTAFDGYYDFSGIDALLKAVVNSATHSKANATELDKQIYGDNLTDYLLNRYYYLEGKIDLHVPVVNSDYQIGLAAAAYIDKDNDVTINATLNIPAIQEMMQVVTNGDTLTNLTVKNGMVYIKRVQSSYWKVTMGVIYSNTKYDTPITIYRVMPVSEFTANMMDNIVFLLNLGPVVTDNIKDTSPAEPVKDVRDFGAQIGKFLKSFIYTGNSNSAKWALTIKGDCVDLGTNMIGLNDIVVTLNASSRYDELTNSNLYTLTGLNIKTGISLLNMLNITVDGNINYCNPQLVMGKQYKDKTVDMSATWEELFGYDSKILGVAASGLKEGEKYTSEQIAASELWNRAIASLNSSYAGRNFLEINLSSSTGVNLGEVALNENGKKVGGLTILYGSSGLLSVAPAIPAWNEKTGYTLTVDYVGVTADIVSGKLDFGKVTDFANLAVNATYTPNTYKVHIVVDEKTGEAYTVDYVYDTRLPLSQYIGSTVNGEDGKVYVLDSFVMDGKKYYGDVESFNITEDATLIANWTDVTADAEYTVTYVADGKTVATQTVKYGEKISGDIVPDINVTGYDFSGWDFCGVDTCYGNREITAIYTPHTYTVTVDTSAYAGCGKEGQLAEAIAEAGFEDNKLSYTYGGAAVKLNALESISGWDFVRYYVLDERGEKVDITSVNMLTEDLTVYAEFKDVRINLNLTSDAAFTYNGQTAVENNGKYVLNVYIIREEDEMLEAENAEGWQFLGWWYAVTDENGKTTYNRLTEALSIVRPGETVKTEIRALWGKATLSSYGTYKDGWNRDYTMESTAGYEFKGFEDLITKINLSSTTYTWHMNDGAALTYNSGDKDGDKALKYTFDKQSISFYKGVMTNWKTTVTIQFVNGVDGNEIILTQNASGKLVKA